MEFITQTKINVFLMRLYESGHQMQHQSYIFASSDNICLPDVSNEMCALDDLYRK